MKLRARIALVIAVLVVPFAFGLGWMQVRLRRNAVEEGIAELARARMAAGEREVCERFPQRWPHLPRPRAGSGGRMRPHHGMRGPRTGRRGARRGAPHRHAGRLFAYGADFESRHPEAPPLDPELVAELRAGADVASAWNRRGHARVAVRMPWDTGPCAVVVVERTAPQAGSRAFATGLWPALLVAAAAIVIAALAAGPVVGRIRRLTAQVRESERDPTRRLDTGGRDEIGELGRAFEASRARIAEQLRALRERDEMLTAYMANTTHDVMLPLTVLQGHLVALRQQLERGRTADTELVKQALEESHYLASLVRNLAAATKLEAGEPQIDRHPVDLGALLERVVARHAPIARQGEVELNHAVSDPSPWTEGDALLLEQAVSNLVHNAVRYNRPGGHVAVVVEPEGDDGFLLQVTDDGPGLSDDELSRLGERHFRGGSARTRHPHGAGLGLHIARTVAERHGMALSFERPADGGLRVRLTGRRQPPPATPPP